MVAPLLAFNKNRIINVNVGIEVHLGFHICYSGLSDGKTVSRDRFGLENLSDIPLNFHGKPIRWRSLQGKNLICQNILKNRARLSFVRS